MAGIPLTRQDLVSRIRLRMTREETPRLTMLVMLGLSGGFAFLTSVLALRAGVDSMGIRYPLAALAGYAAFILLARLWIARRRRPFDRADVLDALDPSLGSGEPEPQEFDAAPTIAAGGRSGGAGASGSWGDAVDAPVGQAVGSAGDGEEVWYLVMAIAVCFGGLVAIGYVVYAAPLLLAELALDAAVVSTLYGRLRTQDTRHWAGTLLRHTWIPATAIIVSLGAAGFVMQALAPEARSIGGVIRELTD